MNRFSQSIISLFQSMNSISLRFYQQLLLRLNQMSIRGNCHKMAVYVHLNPDQLEVDAHTPEESIGEDNLLAFHIMFERNNPDSEWRLVTPLRFID